MRKVSPSRWAVVAAITALASTSLGAPPAIELTVYRTRAEPGEDVSLGPPGVDRRPHAAVRERRTVTLESGVNRIRLERLPSTIDPSTVQVRPARSELRVISTRLVGARPLVKRDLIGEVSIDLDTGRAIAGVVLGSSDGLVAIRDGRVTRLVPAGGIQSARAGGETAIELVVEAPRADRYPLELRYQAGQIRWDVAYTAIRSGDTVELSASLELENRSGATFPGGAVTLIDRVIATVPIGLANGETSIASIDSRLAVAAGPGGLVAGESERELGPTENLPAAEVLVYEIDQPGQTGRFPMSSCSTFARMHPGFRGTRMIELRPGAARMATLVPGSVRLLDRTPGGRLAPAAEGELEIDRRAGAVRLAVGRSQAISARQHQIACESDSERSRLRETLELEIANAGPSDAVVIVRVPMNRWHNWRVISESVAGRSRGGGREYRIEVGASSSATIRLTAVYDW